MRFNLKKVLRDNLVGKVFVDNESGRKGDYNYYNSVGVEYPPFDQLIHNVNLVWDGEDIMILLHCEGGQTYKVLFDDNLTLGE